ncbi:complement C3-like [Pagrus major]|uniref:complement C3-like n=1 Tax=Pagrus major TaxID=143350 RepID=UPI003CC8427B
MTADMGSGRRTQLWLLALLGFSILAGVSSSKVMSAPNVLRVGTVENIFVECQDCSEGDRVEITIKNHPTKTKRLAFTSKTLTAAKNFQDLIQITIPAGDFSKNPDLKQYVYLQAQFPGIELEKVVLVSFQSGYIFIQTDKTLYTPSSKVLYRVFAMMPSMEPMERNHATNTDASIVTEIVTPDGITLPQEQVTLKSGVYSGHHQLGEIVSFGVWKVVAKFHSNPQQSYSAEFEVKEYVLPSFEVKLTHERQFFHVEDKELTINIKARYLFDEDVDGTAYVVFGVIYQDQKKSFPNSLQRVSINKGVGKVKLQREHITQTFQNITDLVGNSIYVAVSVLTESGGEMVEAELRGIQIVTSPYTINFKKSPKYFKPDTPFNVVIEVVNPDGSPAQGVEVVLDPGKARGLTAANGIARLPINTNRTAEPLKITAKTNVPGVSQASATMTAHPYTSKSRSYLHIGVDTAEAKVGDNLKISITLNQHQNADGHITYLILGRGQLLKFGRYETRALTSMVVIISKEMLPSFRIIAYYFTNDNEVVSDSVWVDVEDSCMGSLKLEPTKPANSYKPGSMFHLKITGDPEAIVGLVAVDKGVYVLNNKHRLTQKKVWDLVEKYDTGCTPGGGKDSMSVFYDAGLLFESNKAPGTPYRLELNCPAPRRRKRANTILDVRTSLVSDYQEKKLRECCLDGMRDIPLSYSCERRSKYIVDDPACVKAFLHCCEQLEVQRAEMKQDNLLLARSEEDDNYMDSNDISTRSQFPESWQWTDITLGACQTLNCRLSNSISFPLKDSITTWQFIGISLSRSHGICVADPLEVIVRKDFFIDLRLPYSAVRGEQLEVKAILHNYNSDEITVRVDLLEAEHVCSAASKRRRYRQEVKVGPHTTRSVPFIIIPMKDREIPIEVKAAVRDLGLSDGIRKMLRVVPAGMLIKSVNSITLDPAKSGVDGKQEVILNSQIPTKDLVSDAATRTDISLTGREQIGALVENAISGKSMGTLIKQPSGCGEQNMISMTLPVIATMYLDKTNQWEAVGFKKREEALQHIKTGYQNELAFRKGDGSFAVFPEHKSSTWLTAYVTKVFAMATNLVAVQNNTICDAVKFLISNTQKPDGSFREVGTIIHGEMIGDVRGTDSDASMTAFCLIAMQESRTICNSTISNLTESINIAVSYLEGRLHGLTNSYAAAMTSYALANEDKLNQDILLKFRSSGFTHWPVGDRQLFTLEATAYALLALVKDKDFENARLVVRWFNQQQIDGGGYGSTQATIMVYQAIAEYWIGANEEEYDVNVDIKIQGRANSEKFNFNRDNHYTTRTAKSNEINQDVTVTATGKGEATVTMVSLYYTLPKETESDCQKFNLSVQLKPENVNTDKKIYKLVIKVLYKHEERDATMTILDIGLLTGFIVDKTDLKALSEGHARTISKFEQNTVLSERGSLIIYLNKVSHTEPEEIAFRIHQEMPVGVLQPAAVSVYEYYDHQHNNQTPCVKFYHPEKMGGKLMRLCRNHECTCAEENCSMQKKEKIENVVRTRKICETQQDSSIDFAYKVKLENSTEKLSTDIYTMRIVEVIKEGSDECQSKPGEVGSKKTCDVGPLGKLRPFLSFQHCREGLNLKIGKLYLIMGVAKDIHKDEENQSFQYVLGERTWIEYWPTAAECQTAEYRPTCLGLEEMVDVFTIFGCEAK